MKKSIVLTYHDYQLKNADQRGKLHYYSMLALDALFDEIIYVGWESGWEPPKNFIPIRMTKKYRSYMLKRDDSVLKCKTYGSDTSAFKVLYGQEVYLRNFGIRQATGDIIACSYYGVILGDTASLQHNMNTIQNNILYVSRTKELDYNTFDSLITKMGSSRDNFLKMVKKLDILKLVAFPHWMGMEFIGMNYNVRSKDLLEIIEHKDLYPYIAGIQNQQVFQMAHRDLWESLKGYEETPIDNYGVRLQHKALSLDNTVFFEDFDIYRINDREPVSTGGYVVSAETYETTNGADWGKTQ